MSRLPSLAAIVAALVTLAAAPALADCTDGACVPGGGPERTDCIAEFRAPRPNFPFFDPTRASPKPAKEVRCFDGDAGCDVDGEPDGACTFPVDVCVGAVDPALPSCGANAVESVALTVKKGDGGTLAADVGGLAPAAETACSTGGRVTVALKARKKGGFKSGKALVRVVAKGAGGKDKDKLKLRCLPREWPTHGFDPRNRRASPFPTGITPATVNDLELAWDLALDGAVTSTPTYAHGLLYVTSWDGVLYAVNPKNGKVKWTYDPPGDRSSIQSSAAVTADGRVVIADRNVVVYCLDARKGKLLWSTQLGEAPVDHIWASAQTALGRVFIGVAAFSDSPAAPGRLFALDLDTGETLWQYRAVPEGVCTTDTTVECESAGDCPSGGECVEGLGGAVTATVAIDPTGTQVYMNTVGSFTFPSIGDSDSILRFDAVTGAVTWRHRVTPGEQFGFCEQDSSIDCGTSSVCGAFGPCRDKVAYHDFGFLNGPMLVDDGEGRRLVVSGSKDGSLYALDPDTGDQVWRHEILPVPVSPRFAGWGLFNGAIGTADGRVFGALYGFSDAATNPPNHLQVFDVDDGSLLWADEIGNSWGDIAVAGGVVYMGTQASTSFFAYDAATGERLRTFEMAEAVAGGATIVGDHLFIPYGVIGAGGVQAWRLP